MATNGRTLDKIKGDIPWTKAEERLIAEAPNGFVDFGEGCPEDGEDAPRIRAPLIRHLVTGGCADLPLPDVSVGVRGAVITGFLDLEAVKSSRDLSLFDCRFLQKPDLRDADLGGVYLPGCVLPGVRAVRLKTDRDLHLRNGFHATGEVILRGARITGQLACDKGWFENPGGVALHCDGLQVGDSVFLREGFHATGEVNLKGARITGQLSCIKGRFENPNGSAMNGDTLQVGADVFLGDGFLANGAVTLMRATIQGRLDCSGGRIENSTKTALNLNSSIIGSDLFLKDGFQAFGLVTLNSTKITGHVMAQRSEFYEGIQAEAMQVAGTLFWRFLSSFSGRMRVTDAHVGRLCDDADSWRKAQPLHLSGLRFERLDSTTSIEERLDWLSRKTEQVFPRTPPYRQPPYVRTLRHWSVRLRGRARQFDPQPYSQFALVLHAQGNREGATKVLEERDNRLSRARLDRSLSQVDGELGSSARAVSALVRRHVSDRLFGAVFGYGHRPGRALGWVLGLWIFATLLYAQVWAVDQMAPESAIVLTSADWIAAVEGYEDNPTGPLPLALWKGSPTAKDYETFNAILYALDVFVPLDALGQEAAWAPSPVRGPWGVFGFVAKPLLQIAGWLITAVGAAALTGLVGRKD